MAVPVVAKMPAPIVAPTPSAVRCHLPSERLRPPRSAMSSSQSCTDFRRKSRVMKSSAGGQISALRVALARQGEGDRGRAGHPAAVGRARGGEAKGADHFVELAG